MRSITSFFKRDSLLPLIAGLATGLYPWAFYYSQNFRFVNSFDHILYFLVLFVLFPTAVYYLLFIIFKGSRRHFFKKYLLPFISTFIFLYLCMISLFTSVDYKKIVLALLISFAVIIGNYFIQKLYIKILTVQLLLVFTTFYTLPGTILSYSTESFAWLKQPKPIENIQFQKKPNVYIIQPDGYANFSELSRKNYNFDNSEFENWLEIRGFLLYQDFRSNYSNTLASNSSMFAMKHHHYELWNERKSIMELNPVVEIFKKNDYKTHFFAENPYLFINRPKINFDYINIETAETPYLSKGMDSIASILNDFSKSLETKGEYNFYFFEKLLPGHIFNNKSKNRTTSSERNRYHKNLEYANQWLKELIFLIEKEDPNALIVIIADHGGYVGMEYTLLSQSKNTDRDFLYSIFSSALAIKWPTNEQPSEEELTFRSSVNLFLNLFSYLAEDNSILTHKQENASFLKIKEGAEEGVYKVIDENGNIVFEKHH